MSSEVIQELPKLYTVKRFVQDGHYPNEGGLRALIFNAESNGFHKVIRRINKKVFIDINAFYEWVEEINK